MTERRSAREAPPVIVSLPGALKAGWLAFECKAERRRLAPIPNAWEDLSEDHLADLLDTATSRSKTRRLIE
jgi:hypothetical protein